MARSGKFLTKRDRTSDEVKTALEALRRDQDASKNSVVFHFWAASIDTAAQRNMWPWFTDAAATATTAFILCPFKCTIKRLAFRWAGPGTTATGSVRMDLYIDSQLTSLSATQVATNDDITAATDRDVKVRLGERIEVKCTPVTLTTSPTRIAVSLWAEIDE